ncbi:MAG: phosphoribosylformylglycinamidine synthase subunit PurQ, partial [Pseudomonadota bacterium]
MKSSVIVFPASNCDRDAQVALREISGVEPAMVWHGETQLPETDLIVLPGGFSYGDYLLCGAVAARSPIMADVKTRAEAGVPVIGI